MNPPDDLPVDLKQRLDSAPWQQVLIGWSGAQVFKIEGHGYLKITGGRLSLRPEKERLEWLRGRLPVPEMRYFGEANGRQFMLISDIPGLPSHDDHFKEQPERVVALLADALRRIHALDIHDCPFDQRLDTLIAAAQANYRQGWVETDDFDDIHWGRSAEDLYIELIATRPTDEQQVFVHGDYCLPNILIDPQTWRLAGLIDWGSAGISDSHFDLGLAARSIRFNLGAQWVTPFFEAYGGPIDEAKISYYQLLDEFF
jgi:aminoglycoside phosphotransferase